MVAHERAAADDDPSAVLPNKRLKLPSASPGVTRSGADQLSPARPCSVVGAERSIDYFFPVETSQNPMFDLLGTAPEHKRHVIEEGAHLPPGRF